MDTAIIITLCSLLLVAYLFDLTASRTRIPSVIMLLFLGWLMQRVTGLFEVDIPNLTPLLPILGTIGLILIVLEGSLELEYDQSKKPLIFKSILMAFLPIVIMSFLLAFGLRHFGFFSFKLCLLNIIPLCVISSSIAIPSVRALRSYNREFVIYESSLSDIIGVLFFNFMVLNNFFGAETFGQFGLELLIMIVVSFIAIVGLAFLLNRIEHHIKFVPIILLVVLIYAVSKMYHLPALIFILLYGLFLSNLDELKKLSWIKNEWIHPLEKELPKFRDMIAEMTFLIRAVFFLVFGFLIETAEILNSDTILLAVGIVVLIFVIRALFLLILREPLNPLIFIAPRGLITILLFLAIPATQSIPIINESLMIQIIVITALVMMIGLMATKIPQKESKPPVKEDNAGILPVEPLPVTTDPAADPRV